MTKRRPLLQPISYDELMSNAGMSGFVSFLIPQPEPAREAEAPPEAPPESRRKGRIRRAQTVEDGHSLAEQAVYEALWKAAEPPSDGLAVAVDRPVAAVDGRMAALDGVSLDGVAPLDGCVAPLDGRVAAVDGRVGPLDGRVAPLGAVNTGEPAAADRTVRIGYHRLAQMTRLSWVSVKTNLRSLEKKLAIEVTGSENSATREGKCYRVYSRPAILERREKDGLVWVRRSRGVELLKETQSASGGGR